MAKESYYGGFFRKREAEKERTYLKKRYPTDRVCIRKAKKAGKTRYDIWMGPRKKR